MNHVDKYFWIIEHPNIGVEGLDGEIELTPQMVNPLNRKIEKDISLNTKFEWWVEFNKYYDLGDEIMTHYWELDCGGDTAEEAIEKLYELVLEKYGDY